MSHRSSSSTVFAGARATKGERKRVGEGKGVVVGVDRGGGERSEKERSIQRYT